MTLATLSGGHHASGPKLCAQIDGRMLDLAAAAEVLGLDTPQSLSSMDAYLRGLPHTQQVAEGIVAQARGGAFEGQDTLFMDGATLLPPIPRPPAIFDFGLTPKHLGNSAHTLIKREFGNLAAALIGPIARWRLSKMATGDILPYYKGNAMGVMGPGATMGWPSYGAYLDIEPELAMVIGGESPQIAGYTIFNDASMRDIQLPEMFGTGPARSKDFDQGNGIGPYLVTPDEIPNPRDLEVHVRVGERVHWRGHTSEYSRSPEEVLAFLQTILTPEPGTLIGLGTVPDTTGLDRDEWLEPGDEVEISIEGLGTLVQHLPRRVGPLKAGRWGRRDHPLLTYEG